LLGTKGKEVIEKTHFVGSTVKTVK
jgi:hypothetical protein